MDNDNEILIVEDSLTQALKLQFILEQHDYRVAAANNGREALDYLDEHTPTVVISDIVMPEMDGYEMCRQIKDKSSLKDIPVILLTSLSDPVDVIRGLQCGADNFITKPYQENFLISRIKSVLINRDLRKTASGEWGFEIFFRGEQYTITSDRMQMVDLLFSSFESAVQKNQELESVIRELKSTRDELALAKVAAESANKAKSVFLANMSHDIRTPMNGVIGMLDMLLDTEQTDEQKDFAKSAQLSADSLLMLLNDILDHSKIEAGKLDLETIDFDLRPTLENLSDLMAIKTREKGVEFACLIHERVPCLLKGDPGRLRQILTNLTGNAIKFVEKGEVSVSVDVKEETETAVTLLFKVKDTGIGIPADRVGSLFESFTQVDASTTRKYGGTGLGLAISKQLSELMGGEIGLESEEGKGTTFWFTVVLGKQFEQTPKDIAGLEDIEGKHILVVDDHATNRMVFREYLASWNCRVGEAEKGDEALAKLRDAANGGDPFHIAILDMQMPGMTGETLGRNIKNDPLVENTHLVMATSVGQRGDAERLKKAGFAAFLTKPVKKSVLFDCLRIVQGLKKDDSNEPGKQIVTGFTVEERKAGEETMVRKLQILLAEDNMMNQKVAKNMLKKMGHEVVIANNGEEAVERFKEQDIDLDLILMDGQMPVMDGLEAARTIRDLEKESKMGHIPIIAVTAHAMKGDREKFLASGMDDYISKPLKRKVLEEVIGRVIDA